LGLELRDIAVDWPDFTLSADLGVEEGARVAVIGPSGAGKSTLFSVLAGFEAPVRGRVMWCGAEITHLPPHKRPLTIVFQDHNLFPHLTVAQNVGLGRTPSLRLDAADRADIAKVLARVGLGGMEARLPATLSGGQISRVALARALLRNRPLLLLDEAFAALGPALKSEMLTLVEQVAREEGMTVLLITHDPGDARRFASHTMLVADGRVHPPVPTERFFQCPPRAFTDYMGETK